MTEEIGNLTHSGSLVAVSYYMGALKLTDGYNWIEGIRGKFKICAKVFCEGSTCGIKNGRISKLQICDVAQKHWGFEACYLNYDRGWDIRPTDPDVIEFLNGLLAAFGDEPMGAADLFWYDVYGYHTEDDFENGEREHLMSLDHKDDAMEEARGYVLADEYAVVKVISSDDEEIEIIRREIIPEPKYNHAFDIAFSLNSNHPEGEDVTPEMLKAALQARIENLDMEDSWLEAAGAPFDSYENDSD